MPFQPNGDLQEIRRVPQKGQIQVAGLEIQYIIATIVKGYHDETATSSSIMRIRDAFYKCLRDSQWRGPRCKKRHQDCAGLVLIRITDCPTLLAAATYPAP